MMKIVHEKFKTDKQKQHPLRQDFLLSFQDAVESNKDIEPLLSKTCDVLNPMVVLNLFIRIPEQVRVQSQLPPPDGSTSLSIHVCLGRPISASC